MPAAPRELRYRLRDVHPAAAGMSGKRFRNVMADLVQALRIANHRVRGKRSLVPFTSEWRALHDACPSRWCRYPLAGFMRWCSEQGIAPAAVDTATLQAFMTDLDETSPEPVPPRLRPDHLNDLGQGRGRRPCHRSRGHRRRFGSTPVRLQPA